MDANELMEMDYKLEKEADEFASNHLISKVQMKQLSPTKYITDEEIISFAKSIGIHPGIVAGRLQHEKIIPPNRCAHLKEKYIFSLWYWNTLLLGLESSCLMDDFNTKWPRDKEFRSDNHHEDDLSYT